MSEYLKDQLRILKSRLDRSTKALMDAEREQFILGKKIDDLRFNCKHDRENFDENAVLLGQSKRRIKSDAYLNCKPTNNEEEG